MKNHKLIEGSFSDEEAKDVLKNFFKVLNEVTLLFSV